jgi:hypothetical protein
LAPIKGYLIRRRFQWEKQANSVSHHQLYFEHAEFLASVAKMLQASLTHKIKVQHVAF